MMNYIKDASYYDDLYDLLTIKECLRIDNISIPDDESETLLKQKIKRTWKDIWGDIGLYYKKGERYQNKSKVITDWKLRDQRLQVNEDESFRVSKPRRCIKCAAEMTATYSRVTQIVTTTYSCNACGYIETDTLDLSSDSAEYKKRQAEDRELLSKYRSKYCFSDQEGQDFTRDMLEIGIAVKHFKNKDEKEADPSYQIAQKIKKSSIVEIEALINKSLEHTGFTNLSLDKPELGKYVIVPFTILETNLERSEWNSTNDLRKLLIKTLEPTNWRLMIAGISYRSGYLSGKLKAYETTEDLIKIAKRNSLTGNIIL